MPTGKEAQVKVTPATLANEQTTTKQVLEAGEWVEVLVPDDVNSTFWEGTINGVKMKFPRNQMAKMPKPMAELLIHSSAKARENRDIAKVRKAKQ